MPNSLSTPPSGEREERRMDREYWVPIECELELLGRRMATLRAD